MTRETVFPWDDLGDAYERLHEAERFGTDADVAAARENVDRAKDHLAALGALLLTLALDRGGLAVQKKLARVFGGLARNAWDRATRAGKRVTAALDELDALRQRVRELEARDQGRGHGK